MSNLFVIPQKEKSILAKIENGKVVPVNHLEIPYKSISKICENGLIVTLCLKEKELMVHSPECKLLKKQKVVQFVAMNVKQNIIYLGGKNYVETFSLINMANTDAVLENQELPIKKVSGKSIDDVLVFGNRLLLLDNMVYPKFIFEYDITIPEKPVLTKQTGLPNNGTYEHITKGDINDDWMIVFSDTKSRERNTQFINVTGKTSFCISKVTVEREDTNYVIDLANFPDYGTPKPKKEPLDPVAQKLEWAKENAIIREGITAAMLFDIGMKSDSTEKYEYIDLCLVSNKLFLLRSDCFGYVDLNSSNRLPDIVRIPCKHELYDKLIKTSDNTVVLAGKENYEVV